MHFRLFRIRRVRSLTRSLLLAVAGWCLAASSASAQNEQWIFFAESPTSTKLSRELFVRPAGIQDISIVLKNSTNLDKTVTVEAKVKGQSYKSGAIKIDAGEVKPVTFAVVPGAKPSAVAPGEKAPPPPPGLSGADRAIAVTVADN